MTKRNPGAVLSAEVPHHIEGAHHSIGTGAGQSLRLAGFIRAATAADLPIIESWLADASQMPLIRQRFEAGDLTVVSANRTPIAFLAGTQWLGVHPDHRRFGRDLVRYMMRARGIDELFITVPNTAEALTSWYGLGFRWRLELSSRSQLVFSRKIKRG